jgi:type I restriction enzyme S subunit
MEQLAIAENIGFLLKKCQIMESEISQSEQNAQQLMQAILHEAFEPKPETIVE